MNFMLLVTIACTVLAQLAWCQKRPLAQMTFKVSDDLGNPVVGATIAMGTFHHWQPGEGFGKDISETFTGVTDENGMVTISGSSLEGDFAYGPRDLKGFYRGGGGSFKFKEHWQGKWKPWNPQIEITMKRILNPIPMYAKKVGGLPMQLELPKENEPVGFDLMEGDWVTPFGKGVVADFIFTRVEHIPLVDADKPFSSTLIISFSNPLDGIQSVLAPLNEGSEFRLPRYAPEDGYLPRLEKQFGRPSEGKPIETGTREDQNYFFRVRTVVDEEGNFKSALYGKIVRDISCDIINSKTGSIQFTYYLNPTPLDRNMEFDPKRNLFEILPESQQVFEP